MEIWVCLLLLAWHSRRNAKICSVANQRVCELRRGLFQLEALEKQLWRAKTEEEVENVGILIKEFQRRAQFEL